MANQIFAGYVYNAAGTPVNGATVELFDRTTTSPQRATTTSNSSGYWSIDHATEGRFDVKITSGTNIIYRKYDDKIQLDTMEVANFHIRNPGDTFDYAITPAAITGDRVLNLPLTTATATLIASDTPLADDADLVFGAGSDVQMRWSDADSSNHSFVIGLGNSNQGLHITDVAAVATDWNISATTHPNVYIHSNTTPATDYLRLGDHDGTTAYIDVVGGTTLALEIDGTTEASLTATAFDISGLDLTNDDDDEVLMGTGGDFALLWSDGDSDNHAAVIAIGDTSQALHITDYAAKATDWDIAATTHPNVYIHSNTTPADDFLRLGDHDGTTAYIDIVGGTTIAFEVGGTTHMSLAANSLTGNVVGTGASQVAAGNHTSPAASATASGHAELATVAELETGTDTGRTITPDVLAGSNQGERIVQIRVIGITADASTGDKQATFVCPSSMSGMNLVEVHAEVDTAGTTNTMDIQLRNVTHSADILSTKITIDSNETGSDTAATAAVINTSEDDLATFDVIAVDIDAVHSTAAKGLVVTLIFRLP
jgi:hypothetical protein